MEVLESITAAYVAVGVLAGFLSGMLGVGGGIVMVPILFLLFLAHLGASAAMHVAVATSLGAASLNMLWGAWKHRRAGNIDMEWVRRIGPGAWTGAAIGATLGVFIKPMVVILAVGVMQAFAAYAMIFKKRLQEGFKGHRPKSVFPQGAFIGGVSAITGVAGGILVTPYLIAKGEEPRRAVGSSTLIGTGIALMATAAYIVTGLSVETLSHRQVVGLIHVPALVGLVAGSFPSVPLGVYTAQRVSGDGLRKVLAGVLLISAAKMIWTPFQQAASEKAGMTAPPVGSPVTS